MLFIIGCEGANQERIYFDKIQELANGMERRKYDILFDYAEPFGGDPKCVVERTITKSIGKSNKISVFDHDGKTKKYEDAIDLATENKIFAGYSNFCFDLWLILHKEDYYQEVENQDGYAEEMRRVFKLGKFANIKRKEQVERIVNQITMQDVKDAIVRADIIEARNRERDSILTPKSNRYYNNPDTQVHNVLKSIFAKAEIRF